MNLFQLKASRLDGTTDPPSKQKIFCYLPADFFCFLLNFKCRHWRFICFTASKEKRDPMIEQHLN